MIAVLHVLQQSATTAISSDTFQETVRSPGTPTQNNDGPEADEEVDSLGTEKHVNDGKAQEKTGLVRGLALPMKKTNGKLQFKVEMHGNTRKRLTGGEVSPHLRMHLLKIVGAIRHHALKIAGEIRHHRLEILGALILLLFMRCNLPKTPSERS